MKSIILLFFILFFSLVLQTPIISAQDFPDICQQPENILPNCNFDGGLDRWQTFIEDGSADFSILQGGGECHAPLCPAAFIVSESHFVGGIYQQVSVTAGNTYYANIVWLTFDSLANDASINSVVGGIGRRIGIDPVGGTDPSSPNIVWGPDNWRNDCKICDNQAVIATAQADIITIFIRIDDTWRLRAAEKGYGVPPGKDQFWLDDVGLKQVAGDAAPVVNPTEVPPTNTPVSPPPTETPIPEDPIDTPVPEATDTAALTETSVEVAQTEPTPDVQPVSPVDTSTAKVVAPPPTLTPTNTPVPTDTPIRRPSPMPTRNRRSTATPVASSVLPMNILGIAGTTICAGSVVLLIMVAVIAGLIWLYRLGWGAMDEEEPDQDSDDDQEIIVEVVEDED